MIPTVTRCSVSNCDRPAVAKGICDLHYRRMKRHGHFDQTRATDWGARHSHPLYGYWSQVRRNGIEIIEAWHKDFWTFVRDVGERPSPMHTLFRPDKSIVMGPGNAVWSESKAGDARDALHRISRKNKKEYMSAYNKVRREADPLLQMRIGLKRSHGIELEDFERMMDDQGAVCAICGRQEHRRATNAERAYRLAVDHEHATASIRGLLCSMCNHAIGYLDDSPELLARAIAYLRDPPAAKLGIKHGGKHKKRRIQRPASPYVKQKP